MIEDDFSCSSIDSSLYSALPSCFHDYCARNYTLSILLGALKQTFATLSLCGTIGSLVQIPRYSVE